MVYLSGNEVKAGKSKAQVSVAGCDFRVHAVMGNGAEGMVQLSNPIVIYKFY